MTATGSGPWSLGDAYEVDARYARADVEFREVVRQFHDDGIAVCRGLVATDVVSRARASAIAEFERLGPGADAKLDGAWRTSPALRALAVDPAIVELVEALHGRRAIPFQTLTFRAGSEQAVHADSVHFDTVPSGWMCGVWVALEDVGAAQGPLRYVPGSHRDLDARRAEAVRSGEVPYEDYEDEVAASIDVGAETTFEASAGDVLVWAAHLLHGGSPVVDPTSTRWSQVTHYVFEGGTYVTPRASDGRTGRLTLRDNLVDLRTGRRVPHVVPPGHRLVRVGLGQAMLQPVDVPLTVAERCRSLGFAAVASADWRARAVLARLRRRSGTVPS